MLSTLPVALTRTAFVELVRNLNVYEKSGNRAVHKPLLTLLALAHVQAGKGPKLLFPEIESKLHDLIKEFGNTSVTSAGTAHYPFWYLQNDGYWEVERADVLPSRKGKGEPGLKTMRVSGARAGFTRQAYALLIEQPDLIQDLANVLLDAFPDTLRLDVILAVGLDGDFIVPASKRCGKFRDKVLRAYSYACVVCGFDGRMWKNSVGLEAAHIRWVHFGGPNHVSNGLCLCSLHHKIFDLGVLTIDSQSWQLVISGALNGLGPGVKALHDLHGSKIRTPPMEGDLPLAAHLEWHRKQVFRSGA
ncbi:phosphorothioated DNA-binding restriction endonuclease [Janthinobacterium sp. PSPC1-1]|uniref:phosphorothioated DNA-binding restriction endonuclease n=1 Tax=Janthinobacterium sp. PSPC1-1 TaxID=2804581 RepID=UPI003CE88C4A